jgi:hypothetical protein
MKRVFFSLCCFILFFIPFTGCTSELFAQTGNNANLLSYSKYSSVNPLKGFCPYYASSYSGSPIPFSLEWFYVPLKTLRDKGTSYDFSYIDTILTQISSRGHQAVFRVYIDYPGKGDEVPQFIKDKGIPLYTYTYQKTVNGIEQTLTGCYPDFSAIGFYDDSLTEDTINSSKSSYFCTRMATAGLTDRWKTGVIGGEFRAKDNALKHVKRNRRHLY